MTALRGCPYCKGFMRWDQYACNECNGTNSREAYKKRTAVLVANLNAAAWEEMRARYLLDRTTHPEQDDE